METRFLKDALFAGMTSNAFKLGTVLTLGWFWPRIGGCSALYRGGSMWTIDFGNILTVTEQDAETISPPSYLLHESDSTYFYVVRRINNCGYEEHTIVAAVKVAIDSDGDIAELQPNKIFTWQAIQVEGNKIRLIWFYCPLEQKTTPVCFKVYFDGGTGQIDYENPIATIDYEGRRFYSYLSNALDAGRYLFAIRPEDTSGIKNSTQASLRIQLNTTNPDAIEILSAEAV